METARALAEMTRKGWKPKRTIVIGFWDGEEFGLIGSTEWMEKHAEELDQKLIAYINADSTGKGKFTVNGSHSLESFMQQVARDVNDPVSGKPISSGNDFRIGALGSGSDYTPFLQHLGIASLDVRFAANDSGVYHSDYDDFNWFSHFSDTNFTYGKTLSRVHTTMVMRLADAPVLPFEFDHFVSTVRRYVDEIQATPNAPKKAFFDGLRDELTQLAASAMELNEAEMQALPRFSLAAPAKLAELNRILFRTERSLTLDPGLPGRPWYRHRIYAPGQYTGYDAKTLPGIREAVEAGKTEEARTQADQVIQVLRALNDQLAEAVKLAGQL
jgi:N-acetylated-alpha-linked acidic dipeptidase